MLENDSVNNLDVMLENPKRALIRMSIPLIISLFITSFYNLVDAAWYLVLEQMHLQVLVFSLQYL